MITSIPQNALIALVITTVLFLGSSIFLYITLRKSKSQLAENQKKLSDYELTFKAQKDLSQIMTMGVATFLQISLNESLKRVEDLENELKEFASVNSELTQWVTDFQKLTGNVYKQLKSIDERGMFEKDDDVGFLFQDMLGIITEYNRRINSNDNNTADEKQTQK
jgi:DNA-binding protein YbaB